MGVTPKGKRGISTVVAMLLIAAITISGVILYYIWSTGLLGQITGTGPGPVTEQLILEVYDWKPYTDNLTLTIKNLGRDTVNISSIYVEGTGHSYQGVGASFDTGEWTMGEGITSNDVTATLVRTIDSQEDLSIVINMDADISVTSGSTYQVIIVTENGGRFTFNPLAGKTG